MQAMEKHGQIPSTFDDRTPEEAFHAADLAERLQIGEVCRFQDGQGNVISGVVADGTVDIAQRKAFYGCNLESGTSFIVQQELGEADIAVYQASPETYFGAVKPSRKPITRALDAFDFCYESCKNTPREKLLHLMSAWPEPASRENLPQQDLARRYSAAMAESLLARMKKPQASPFPDGQPLSEEPAKQ